MRKFIALAGLAGLAPLLLGAAPPVQPGQWQFQGKVVSAVIPGAPPEVVKMITSKPQNHSVCLTPKDAAANPRALWEKSNGKCKYAKFVMAGGKIDSVMTCTGQGMPGTSTIVTTGTYTPTSYAIRSTMDMKSQQGTMKMVVRGTGKRTGACK